MLRPHEIEDVLERFRDWLTATAEDLDADDIQSLAARFSQGPMEPAPNGSVGLLQVVETLTALRHDLKLESKSVRSLRESTETALEGLHRATEQLESSRQEADRTAERAIRPFLDKLVMLDELIGQAQRSAEQARATTAESPADRLRLELEDRYRRLPRWRRVAAARWHDAVRNLLSESQPPPRSGIEGLVEGLRLLRTRATAALADLGIERIACVGRRVDPEKMRVVDVVETAGRNPETVVEELRPGYTYHGKIVQFAEVRATQQDASV